MKIIFSILLFASLGAFAQVDVDSTKSPVLANSDRDTIFVEPEMFDLFVTVWQMEKDPDVIKPVIVSTEKVYMRATRSRRFNYEN